MRGRGTEAARPLPAPPGRRAPAAARVRPFPRCDRRRSRWRRSRAHRAAAGRRRSPRRADDRPAQALALRGLRLANSCTPSAPYISRARDPAGRRATRSVSQSPNSASGRPACRQAARSSSPRPNARRTSARASRFVLPTSANLRAVERTTRPPLRARLACALRDKQARTRPLRDLRLGRNSAVLPGSEVALASMGFARLCSPALLETGIVGFHGVGEPGARALYLHRLGARGLPLDRLG